MGSCPKPPADQATGKAIWPRVAPIAAWFAADATTPLSRPRGPAQSSVPTSGGRSWSDAEKRERGLGENGLSDLQRRKHDYARQPGRRRIAPHEALSRGIVRSDSGRRHRRDADKQERDRSGDRRGITHEPVPRARLRGHRGGRSREPHGDSAGTHGYRTLTAGWRRITPRTASG